METIQEALFAKYPKNIQILAYYRKANGCDCTWENLTKLRLQKYVDYMSERLAPNTVKTYCARLKTILNSFNEEVDLPKDYAKILSVRKDNCENVYLDDDELKQVIAYEPTTEMERVVKNWFLIGCFTGARHSDYIRFSSKNIHDGQLHYVSIKTHTKTSVPLSPYVSRIIRENEERGYNDVKISDVYFNRMVKRICCGAGINTEVSVYMRGQFQTGEKWQYIASHTARRSFATNLFKRGVDILTISKLCGHSSVEMTKQYICCGPIINESVLDYFNEFI